MVRSRKQSLLDEKNSLQRRLKEIETELSELSQADDLSPRSKSARPDQQPANTQEKKDSANKSLRVILIDMLTDTQHMMTNTVIRQLYEAKYQKTLSSAQLSTLSAKEEDKKDSQNTTVYGLAHPIKLVDGKIIKVKNIWARSNWPISRRIHLPITERLISLYFLDWHITASGSTPYKYLNSPIILRYIEGLIRSLELDKVIQPPYDSIRAKKIVIQEIEKAKALEETDYSKLAFKTLATHKLAQKHYDPELYSETEIKN